jgi:iron complex outermembrane receptor protein
MAGRKSAARRSIDARRVAMLLVSTALAASIGFGRDATAQTAANPAGAARIEIPAEPLDAAIRDFIRATGLQVAYPAALSQGKESAAVSGNLAPGEALARLLAGSGLTYRYTSATTVTLENASAIPSEPMTLAPVKVEGESGPPSTAVLGNLPPPYAGGQVATGGQVGMLGNRNVMDTPFSQTSYTSQTIQDSQARTIADVLQNDPSVRIALGAGFENDQYYIRGFRLVANDIGFNGLYGLLGTFAIPPDYAERVEVLKGPSNLLNGMPPGGSIGGSINIVAKRAADEPLTQFTTSYMSTGNFGEHVDIGRRFGEDDACGVRFNGSYRNGDIAIDRESVEFGSAALGLDCRGDRFRLSGDFAWQRDNANGSTRDVFLPTSFIGVPAAPNATKNFQPPWGFQITQDTLGMVQGEFDLTDKMTAHAAIGAHNDNFHYKNYIYDTVNNLAGDFTTKSYNDALYYKILSAQAGLRWSLDTGPVNHVLNFNFSDIHSIYGFGYITGPTYSGNIYTSPYGADPHIPAPLVQKSSVTDLPSVGVADTLSILDNRVQLTAGVRHQQVAVDSYNAGLPTANGLLTSSYQADAWSPAFTLLVKPFENGSLYANYIQGLQAGTVVGSTYANAGAVLPPYVSKQIETGVKVDWGRVTSTLSFFQITQPSTVPVAGVGTALPTLALNGEQRNRGIELENFGEPVPGVRVLGGLTVLDARQVETANHLTDGKVAVAVPDFQLNVGAEWDTPFIRGFTLNGRVVYTGAQYNDAANLQRLPDWTRLDLGARYALDGPWSKPIVVRFNIENVLNKNYWSQSSGGFLELAAPRIFLLSVATDF